MYLGCLYTSGKKTENTIVYFQKYNDLPCKNEIRNIVDIRPLGI